MSAEKFATARYDDSGKSASAADLTVLLAQAFRQLQSQPGGFHPARDAVAMRAFVRSAPPALGMTEGVLARIWRTLAGDAWATQASADGAPRQICLAGGDPLAMTEAARGYFGFLAPLTPMTEIREALDRVVTTPGALACLPWPEQAGPGQWWPMLNEQKLRGLSIVAGWPSLAGGDSDLPRMAIVAQMTPEASGDDDMLATVHDDRREAEAVLAQAGLKAEVTARARSLALVRIGEFVAPDDPRLAMAARLGLDGLRLVGVRPKP